MADSSSSNGPEAEAGPSNYQLWAGESDVEEEERSDSENSQQEEQEDLEAAKADIPLKALSKAQKLLLSSKKRKRKQPPAIPPDVREQAIQSLSKLKRSGRQEPRKALHLEDERPAKRPKVQDKAPEHRANKHAPMEMSSKKAVSRFRTTVEIPKKQSRDPRFDSANDALSKDMFEKAYSFLHDQRKEELARLRGTLKKVKKNASISPKDKEELERKMQRMQSQVAEQDRKQREKQAVKQWKTTEMEKQATEGKKPFFLKHSQKQALLKESKLEELSHDKKRLRKHQRKHAMKEVKRDARHKPPDRINV